jgi:hypothetical protein
MPDGVVAGVDTVAQGKGKGERGKGLGLESTFKVIKNSLILN